MHGEAIDREMSTGLVTIAIFDRKGERLIFYRSQGEVSAGLENLDGIEAQDCNEYQQQLERLDVEVTMPTAC